MKRMNNVRQVAGDEFNMSDDAPVFLRRRLFLGKPENQGGAMIVVEISKPYKKDFDVACRVCIKEYKTASGSGCSRFPYLLRNSSA